MIEISSVENESRMSPVSARTPTDPGYSGSIFIRTNSWLVLILMAVVITTGCRSRVIRVSLTNTSEQPLSAVIVDYPNATFGVNTLAPGTTFQYTIKPLDNGVLKIQFTDANGKVHSVAGPAVRRGQEGTIVVRINQDSVSAGSTLR